MFPRLSVYVALALTATTASATSIDYVFGNGFEPSPLYASDQRFSLMWINSSGVAHQAAIRGDASIRSTDDPTLAVAHVGVGHYCIVLSDVGEGIVGVLQDEGGTQGTIDVTMGVGNPCPQEFDARVSVRTWQLP
jgi:hypothetical protein